MGAWDIIKVFVSCLFGLLVSYQVVYIIVGLFAKKKYPSAKQDHTYGILIAGRNEEKVIGQLLDSIKKQNYPIEKLKIFVVADNCSEGDKTAEVAANLGAVVYERHNLTKIGKSFALDFLFKNITKNFPDYKPDGWFIFDADNLLDKSYIKEMNKAFDFGEKIVTSYRNSKNYGTNLYSMGASIHFIRQSRFLHTPRDLLGLSTHVSGTGFLFSSEILDIHKGWQYGKLTEDLEFSCDNLIKGNKVAYCDDAIFYDEQPTTWKQTYRQRMRWQKGTYQCTKAFIASLFIKIFTKHSFAFYDFFIYFFPLPLISTSWALVNVVVSIVQCIIKILGGAVAGSVVLGLFLSILKALFMLYLGFFLYGSLAVIKDYKRINASHSRKILSMFAYPIFMVLIIPTLFLPLFKRVEWTPIQHDITTSIDDISKKSGGG